MKRSTRQKGQALLLVALAFVGLAAFIGLAVDAGILLSHIGHLRRAVDAASLAAANQFREGRTPAELSTMALELIRLNGLNPSTATAYICDLNDPGSPYHDPTLCPPPGEPPRKFVRVKAQLPVNFAFLPIIGFTSVTIEADAVSEAASLDLVLIIDTSPSMAFDARCDDAAIDGGEDDDAWAETNLPGGLGAPDGVPDDCGPTRVGGFDEDYLQDPDNCNPVRQCHPFEEVRAAALALVARTYFPYDRMGLITFDRDATVDLPLKDGTNKIIVSNAINAMEVYKFPGCPGYPPDPSGCTPTNIADGLRAGGNQFGAYKREEAVWIVILLSDGATNAATDEFGVPICPGAPDQPTWVQPFCRDAEFELGVGDFGYDAEDAAVDQAYFVGCPDALSPQPPGCPSPGQGAVVFTIGLGQEVVADTACDPAWYPSGCEVDQGERLLRFVAAVGDDGDPATDPCAGKPVGQSCGNYYYSPTGDQLLAVFEAIASRIFTRITH